MYLRIAYCKIRIADYFYFETGDNILVSADVVIAEQERASSCNIAVYDPNLRILNLILSECQSRGGIMTPANLLETPAPTPTADGSAGAASGAGVVALGSAFIKNLEAKYGPSDLTGLTAIGQKALAALASVNVQAFMKAIAVAELGAEAEAKGGYGYLFGDTNGKETYDPRTLTTHPKKRVPFGNTSSSATGRYQTMDFVWDEEAPRLGLKDFKPVSQEILGVGRLIYRQILDYVINGQFEQAITGNGAMSARYEWASLEGNPYGQGTPGGKRSTFLANINKFRQSASTATTATVTPATVAKPAAKLNDYDIVSSISATTAPIPIAIPKPGATATPANSSAPNIKPTATDPLISPTSEVLTPATPLTPAVDLSQGIEIIIEMGMLDKPTEALTSQFFLTEVRGGNDIPHMTKLVGKQIDYVLAKASGIKAQKNIYKVYQNTTLRQIASKMVSAVGGVLGVVDPVADKVIENSYQTGSNYDFLLKLAKSAGLFIRADGDKLELKPLDINTKPLVIKSLVLMNGCSWGDQASNDRIVKSDDLSFKVNPAQGPPLPDPKEGPLQQGDKFNPIPVSTPSGVGANPAVPVAPVVVGPATPTPGIPTSVQEAAIVAASVQTAYGIQDLKVAAKEGTEIGKGFEGTININTMLMHEVLKGQPGQILEIDKDTGYGEAIARQYHMSQLRHSYKSLAITSAIEFYLPVKIKPSAIATAPATGSSPAVAPNLANLPANLTASPKEGDQIAGHPVTSPYGYRDRPTAGASNFHQGVDVAMPEGTNLYLIADPGQMVQVTAMTPDQSGGGGNVAVFKYSTWTFNFMHCSQVFTGLKKAGDIIAKSGNTGTSTGPHCHFTQRKPDNETVPTQSGYIFWALTGKKPT